MIVGQQTNGFNCQDGDLLDQGPPSDEWAERALVASILIDSTRFAAVAQIVTTDDFIDQRCKFTFAAMQKLYADHLAIDATLTIGMLDDRGQLDRLGDGRRDGPSVRWFIDLLDLLPSAMYAEHYARRVAEISRHRRAHYRGVNLIRGVGRLDAPASAQLRRRRA